VKIYVSHSTKYDYKHDLYDLIRSSELNTQHEFFLPHESQDDGVFAKDIIREADLLIAEVSEPSTGQGIELGWADAYDVHIVCVYREGSQPSGSLRFVSDEMHSYSDGQLLSLLEKITS
jgi:hypothetical protein